MSGSLEAEGLESPSTDFGSEVVCIWSGGLESGVLDSRGFRIWGSTRLGQRILDLVTHIVSGSRI